MESTDSPSNKKNPLEDLSKDELIKKCNNFLLIAKKAKQAKDESSEELKKYKENEMKLSSDVAALKEVVESFNKKQTEFAEVQNKHKLSEEKNSELKRNFQELEEKYAQKIMECSNLKETLKQLSDKISILEISNSEYIEKLSYFKENYAQLDIENKINLNRLKEYQQNEIELKKKMQLIEEKYIKLELTLKEFQGKYLEECKNHEELQETLIKLQNRSSSGRCSSRSSDSLKPVYENQEYDEMLEKYNELIEKNKLNILEIERLNKKLLENEKKFSKNTSDGDNERFVEDAGESEKPKGASGYNQLEYDKLLSELNEKNKLLTAQDGVIKENDMLKGKIQNLEASLNESMNQYKKAMMKFDQCQNVLTSVSKELELEKEQSSEKLNEYKNLLNEKNEVLSQKLSENGELTQRLLNLEHDIGNCKTIVNEITKKYEILFNKEIATDDTSLLNSSETDEKCLPKVESLPVIEEHGESSCKEMNQNSNDNRRLSKQLQQIENILLKMKKNYESAVLEKNKLIEIYESDKSAEEVFKQNITELKQELMMLRNENVTADIKYKEMEQKLEESRIISELLKKEIDGKCDEYDAFKKEMEFYKIKNDELSREISERNAEYSRCKEELETLKKVEKEHINVIETLKENLKSAKIFEEKFAKLEEDLRREENRREEKSYAFENLNFEHGEKYKCVLNKYIKHGNVIESSSLVRDLFEMNEEREKLPGKAEKQDKDTGTDEDLSQNANNVGEQILSDKIKSLHRAMKDVKALKTQMNREVLDCFSSLRTDNVKIMQDLTKSISNVYYNLQHGNSELLTEMNDMNQVLKERGLLISKLEKLNESQSEEIAEAKAKISQLEAKLSEKKNNVKKMLEELDELKLEIENKEKVIKDMEEEIWKLKNSDSHGETLSSSTISRVEEAARLLDVEESFEERYSKLKVIAVKLKKKVSEQQNQLEEERSKSVSKNNELQTKIANFQAQIKSLMNIQAEYDRLQDLYEGEKTERNALRKVLESANEKIDGLKQEIEDAKKEKEKLLNEKNGFDNIKKKLSAQVITLKASVEEEKNKQMKLEKELEKVEYERALKEKKLEEEKERHKGTRALFEKQKMEAKNLGVLKLEIAEYERSVGDLERKLAVKEEEINELNCLVENQKSQCKLYLDEITRLKSQLTEENERATEANNQMKKFNEESSSREVEFKEKLNEIGMLKTAVEDKKKELEEMTLELAKISQEKLKLEEKYKSIQDHSSREIHSLQDTVASLQDSLNQKELEVDEIKKEFDAYKVRAQSVLRQSQKEVNQSKQRNVMEELEQLKITSESLKARLEESGLKMQKLVEENEVFQEEKNRLYVRIQELKNSLAELRTENQELKESKQKEHENHSEALKLQKLQSETLAHCFQKKIEELQANHKCQMEELTKDYEQLQKKLQTAVLNTNEKREHNDHRRSSSNFIPVKSDKEILDVMLLEREECEGSESTDSVSPQIANNTNLIPLDQLLNSSDHTERAEEKRSPLQDVNRLNDKLEKSENRIKHLTVLLSEAETDCARLQQLNDVLKEEIRRNQRNVEREQHAQNFEYMKNVVIKFISLHNVDEKVRLVPVLNTILKLSPEEENILANAARGILEPSNSNRGWGSYLNIWSGAQ